MKFIDCVLFWNIFMLLIFLSKIKKWLFLDLKVYNKIVYKVYKSLSSFQISSSSKILNMRTFWKIEDIVKTNLVRWKHHAFEMKNRERAIKMFEVISQYKLYINQNFAVKKMKELYIWHVRVLKTFRTS